MLRWSLAIAIVVLLHSCGLASAMPRRIAATSAAFAGLTCTEWRAYDAFDPGSTWVTCTDPGGHVETPYESPRTNFLGQLFAGFGPTW